ncbi:MAG: hypothetical protein B6245_18335 [Desulfobacteraceae bacterium 4572_88]|nr:MAG: hypothetical protein B6245_18335 [Desulfobacteraceae bacterium 4572_88]
MIIMLIRIRWQADDAEIPEDRPLALTPGLFITSGKLLAISAPVLSPRGADDLLHSLPLFLVSFLVRLLFSLT